MGLRLRHCPAMRCLWRHRRTMLKGVYWRDIKVSAQNGGVRSKSETVCDIDVESQDESFNRQYRG